MKKAIAIFLVFDPVAFIVGNFSSIYELFPSKKYFDSEYSGSGYLAKEMGVYLNYDATIEHLENRYSHFNISLANHAENFHDTLYYNSSEHITNLVNTYYIAGYHVNTVCVMQYYSIKNLFYIATNEGDGMLPQWSATLCTRYPEKVFYVDGIDHTTLVKNVDVLSFVNQLVRNDTSIKKSDNLIGTEMNWP